MNNKATVKDIIISGINMISRQEVEKSIALYKLIKDLYKRNTDVASNIEFKWAYSAFYGLATHYPKAELGNYFRVMQNHLDNPDKELLLENIVNELESSKKQYVFASKLMNFVNDDIYPIIDSNVVFVFGFSANMSVTEKYNIINEAYSELLNDEHIVAFFSQYDWGAIGKMKKMDIIVWNFANKLRYEI